jgi:two-component system NarL family sensor kinase
VLSWVLQAQPAGVRDFSDIRSLDSAQLEEVFSWAFAYTDDGNDSILLLSDTLIKFTREEHGEYLLAQAYDLKSVSSLVTGDWALAITYQDSAIAIRRSNHWNIPLGNSYLHLARVYWDEGEMQERGENFDAAENSFRISLGYNEKALVEFRAANNQRKIALAKLSIGVSHYFLYDYEQALQYFKQVIDLSLKENDSILLADAWINMSNVYGELDQRDSAVYFYDLASVYYKNSGNLYAWYSVRQNMADFYIDQPLKAIEILEEIDSASRFIGDLSATARIQEHLSYAHQMAGNYKEALEYYKGFKSLKDSMLNTDFKSQELDVRYQTNRYKEEIQRQKEESLRQELALQKTAAQRQRLQIIVFSLAILLALAIGFYYWRRAVMQKLQRQKLLEMEQSKNLETARAMISGQEQERIRIAEDLHDRLGSTLSAAKMQMEAASSRNGSANKYLDKSSDLIDKAIGDTREISHNLISGVLVKLGLAAALEDLKESLEVTNRLKINLDIRKYSGLPRKTELQLFRITQELVNNSVKHSGGSEISVKLGVKNGTTYLSVADNGCGFDLDKVKSGLGLMNIQRRVEAISGNMDMTSDSSGSIFTVSVPEVKRSNEDITG